MKRPIDSWWGDPIPPGQTTDVWLPISESYTGISLRIPIRIVRSDQPGPVLAVTAALHGDEINGAGAVRSLAAEETLSLRRGSLILVPVLNVLAFDRHSRYLPDRRDLNRCFPGSASGSLASRIARVIFDELVLRCDAIVDLHSAALRRTNYPNVRGDLSNPAIRKMAIAFGGEVIVDCKGTEGTLRREASAAGSPTIILEGGEVWKVEPAIVDTATRGIKNVLRHLKMLDGSLEIPEQQFIVQHTQWVRADHGGFLHFHVQPGQLVRQGQPLATNTDLLGKEVGVLHSPFDGILIGMTTIPSVSPGEPVCHIGRLPRNTDPDEIRQLREDSETLEQRTMEELGTNVTVIERADVTGSSPPPAQ